MSVDLSAAVADKVSEESLAVLTWNLGVVSAQVPPFSRPPDATLAVWGPAGGGAPGDAELTFRMKAVTVMVPGPDGAPIQGHMFRCTSVGGREQYVTVCLSCGKVTFIPVGDKGRIGCSCDSCKAEMVRGGWSAVWHTYEKGGGREAADALEAAASAKHEHGGGTLLQTAPRGKGGRDGPGS